MRYWPWYALDGLMWGFVNTTETDFVMVLPPSPPAEEN